jgi:hypothetical protein
MLDTVKAKIKSELAALVRQRDAAAAKGREAQAVLERAREQVLTVTGAIAAYEKMLKECDQYGATGRMLPDTLVNGAPAQSPGG